MTTWREARQEFRNLINRTADLHKTIISDGTIVPSDPRYLRNSDVSVRRMVAQSLAIAAVKDCSSRVMQHMLIALNDTDQIVRETVSLAFGVCGYAPAVDGLIRLLANPNSEHREQIGHSLCAIGETAVPKLLSCLASEQGVASQAAGNALFNMGPDVVDWLMKEFSDSGEDWMWSLSILAHFPRQTKSALQVMLALSDKDSAPRIIQTMQLFDKILAKKK